MSILTVRNTKSFTDLDLDFDVHPNTKKLNLLNGEAAVIRSLKNLISTDHYERPFHPEIGCSIRASLFDPIMQSTAMTIENRVRECIDNFEPRVDLIKVSVVADPDHNRYNVTIGFFIVNQSAARSIDLFLERIR